MVFATDEDGQVAGIGVRGPLIKADPARAPCRLVVEPDPPHVHPDWDVGAIVRKMSDFNLMVAPVMDEEHHNILGVVTVDDVLELLLPTGWRRDFGTHRGGGLSRGPATKTPRPPGPVGDDRPPSSDPTPGRAAACRRRCGADRPTVFSRARHPDRGGRHAPGAAPIRGETS